MVKVEIRYTMLEYAGRGKITHNDGLDAILCIIDELADYTVTSGTKDQQEVRILRRRSMRLA